jgi:hypothetical protein
VRKVLATNMKTTTTTKKGRKKTFCDFVIHEAIEEAKRDRMKR